MSIEIREEHNSDLTAITDLNKRVFGQDHEANLVDALRSNGSTLLSLVAILNDKLVGHIMYSPARVGDKIDGAALGPMAVLPDYQRRGIGSELVKTGNQRLKDDGWPFIIVLGHALYYPRFGFKPASTYGISCEWDVPDNVFMLLVLDEERMQGISGLSKYRQEFSSFM